MFHYAIIKSNDTIEHMFSYMRPDYDTINACVGGWLEGVALNGVTAYVHEEGKLMGMPVNKIATLLSHRDEAISPQDYIVGDMFVAGPLDDEGDITSLSEDWLTGLAAMLGITSEGV